MVIKFNNNYLQSLAKGEKVKGKPRFNSNVVEKFKKLIVLLQVTPDTAGLKAYNSLNFEALKGDLKGLYSVRVDYQYRLVFSIEKDLITIREIIIIEDLTNHYQ